MTFSGWYWNCEWYKTGACKGQERSACYCEHFKDYFVPHHDRMKDKLAKEFFRLAIENHEPVLKKEAEAWAEMLIRTMEGKVIKK
jgi:hypothetical protein